ncbi:SDR family NAD(P)-dependent oxidoreductase [Salinadaptatus halalkaliphilus]|uniref:SDR family NAD(P)-dependent oxidoreductase n=1 Tax=Salinadaptatus halalkaliphilus TaxID=2419781 RepID=A0A4S3TH35_9EURY|nr:SDR family NAD(P)-dependent oxidoreductase [Salinadaptatus halalkaliphilus]THE63211.1 SDR family NAD(P)-dependent oxidoreductase [Salinadaptatus halalkaliphilus]
MELDIHDNTTLVSASSSGLGKASAKILAREGANVVINGRDQNRLEEAVDELRESADALHDDGGGTIVNITSRSVKEAIPPIALSNTVRMGVVGRTQDFVDRFVDLYLHNYDRRHTDEPLTNAIVE